MKLDPGTRGKVSIIVGSIVSLDDTYLERAVIVSNGLQAKQRGILMVLGPVSLNQSIIRFFH